MNCSMLNRFMELCELVGIKTLSDLRIFADDYGLTAPNGEQLISALEKEIGLI
nr:MAG TPA: hypothetical protein [Caudoviricetes sp.]